MQILFFHIDKYTIKLFEMFDFWMLYILFEKKSYYLYTNS